MIEDYIPYITGISALIIAIISLIISFKKLQSDKGDRIFQLMRTIDDTANESLALFRRNNYQDTIAGMSQFLGNYGRLIFLYQNNLISKKVVDQYKTSISLSLLYIEYLTKLFPNQAPLILEDAPLLVYCKENNIEKALEGFFRPKFEDILKQREEFLKKDKSE